MPQSSSLPTLAGLRRRMRGQVGRPALPRPRAVPGRARAAWRIRLVPVSRRPAQSCRDDRAGGLLRHKRLTSVIDRGSILLVVYAAFSAGMVAGVWRQIDSGSLLLVLAADLVLLGAVLFVNVLGSRVAKFSKEDEITIVFCGSKKSMAGGIPMANILFPGHVVSLIVLPLMLFHQAQLFACAALAQRYAHRMTAQSQGHPAAASAGQG